MTEGGKPVRKTDQEEIRIISQRVYEIGKGSGLNVVLKLGLLRPRHSDKPEEQHIPKRNGQNLVEKDNER